MTTCSQPNSLLLCTGFDAEGTVKLFDFGLAREMLPSDRHESGLFRLTAETGSPRYMDPNIALGKPYNERADVYSLCILLWEILSLETPFSCYSSITSFHEKVHKQGRRPKCNIKWPYHVTRLLERGWAVDIEQRPTMKEVVNTLGNEMHRVARGERPFDVETRNLPLVEIIPVKCEREYKENKTLPFPGTAKDSDSGTESSSASTGMTTFVPVSGCNAFPATLTDQQHINQLPIAPCNDYQEENTNAFSRKRFMFCCLAT
jgi:serine/threonine protein kinase